ncbi:LuxR C-terminal-related transcriptional regulator (plasmid) [Streptomyces sp. NBC_01340]|uniref:helix-turn-helix transcriptional regulator n=1 Tax=unclassified Streptomyces TaxID=2593676 RepID=UPI00224F112C|nr:MULTISPECIES: LuxR C-terminal-related transcriptional regulator [unclassified Streptomyces]MCX4460803.1 LuxR C-terminal-related transcriptional regulator [Streptomyces sp. NBC_01719]MCX4499867.1 LuxR C-terminal-related transcriptional regulator [Streptomyces sp. NBC_01728]WSI44996.1 LuxR C-terminal-related transcriptional regulator [Streptomyces sp. NBC_01340]
MQIIVLAEDRLTAQGVEAHLAADSRVLVLPSDTEEEPDVLLVITVELTQKIFKSMQRFCREDKEKSPRLVLVANKPTAEQLVRVVQLGLVAFMPRDRTTLADITEMLCAVSRGVASLPPSLLGSLLDQFRTRNWSDHAVEQSGDSPPFTAREIAVLRQLAAGFSTTEIAAALHYSERTVKYIIHEMIARHGLRNRVHAVAYALRQGFL